MELLEHSLLTLLVATPLAVGLLLLASGGVAGLLLGSGGLPNRVWQSFGIAGSLLTLAFAVLLWNGFDPETGGLQLVEYRPWIPRFGIHWFVGIDGIGLMMVLLTALLVPVALVASLRDVQHSVKAFVFFVLSLESALLGAFVSLNLFQFYVLWQIVLVPLLFLIGIWGGPERVRAAVKLFLFAGAGSLAMLVGVLALAHLNAQQGGVPSFDLIAHPLGRGIALLETVVPTAAEGVPFWHRQHFLFGVFAFAFATVAPLVPLHTWLPEAHVEAPTAGSALLAAACLQLGVYGFLRFALPLFPVAAAEAAPLVFALALVAIVHGSLVALVQSDVKRLVAYTSVAQLGFVMLGLFALNDQGLAGGVVQTVSHGMATAGLFLCIGFLYERRGTRAIAEYGGVARPMPVLAALFGVLVMASLGLPALSGFVGEFLILLGAFDAAPGHAAAATVGVALGAGVLLWMYRRVMLGPVENGENRGLIDLDWRERSCLIALVVPIVVLGLHPNPVLRRIEPSVISTLELMQRRTWLTEGRPSAAAAPAAPKPAAAGGRSLLAERR